MARRISSRLPGLFFAAFAVALSLGPGAHAAWAQSFDATNLRQPTSLNSATWLVNAGDDPAYARPGFDDSHWTRFNPSASLKTVLPSRPPIVWYRLHLKVAPEDKGLALSVQGISEAFEVYANGQRILQTGRVSPYESYTVSGMLTQSIADAQVATGSVVLALRVHLAPLDWDLGHPGLSADDLMLGQKDALREHVWLTVIGQNLLNGITNFASFGLGIVALAMFLSERRRLEYLWMSLQFLIPALILPLSLYELFHDVPAWLDALGNGIGFSGFVFIVLMYFAFLRIPFGRWIQILVGVAAVGYLVALAEVASGRQGLIAIYVAFMPLVILWAGVIPVLLVIHFRRGNREAGILLIPVILLALNLYIEIALGLLSQVPAFAAKADHLNHLLLSLHAGPFRWQLGDVCNLLYVLSLAIIIVLRSTRISRQQAALESELAAASEVQQVILPELEENVPGLVVESIYAPAQQVGGDFFQIVPQKRDDSLLIVAGDVTGKGLKAGMLVALLVGAIRTTVETTQDPLAILQTLNRRLLGRGDAQATCLAMRIGRDGAVTLANAGHLAPYRNGEPVEMEGSLPLGTIAGAEFSVSAFRLREGDRLTLISDGVAEAMDAKGNLFGFERVRELLLRVGSAAEVARAAQQFGQEDDISVIAVTRSAVPVPALA